MKKRIIIAVAVVVAAVLAFGLIVIFSRSSLSLPLENGLSFAMTDTALKLVKGQPDETVRDDNFNCLSLTYADESLFEHGAEISYHFSKGDVSPIYRLTDVSYIFSVSDSEDGDKLFDFLTEKLQNQYREDENYYFDETSTENKRNFGLDFGATSLTITVTHAESVKVDISYLF